MAENLADKYRPKTLTEYVGQQHAIDIIQGQLKSGKIEQSFLITGETGVGKTTLARIIARYVNCLNPIDNAPCGKCASCKSSNQDVVEMNIGTSRGIDDIRAVVSASKFAPKYGKHKIFILDEVHQLASAAAASALLVPIEKSPPHVIWILCTTNPEKLLPTIVGRCKHIALKTIEQDVIVNRLYKIAKKEGVDFKTVKGGKNILTTIAESSYGHMRNAISTLGLVLDSFNSNKKVDLASVTTLINQSAEADIDVTAANLLLGYLADDIKYVQQCIRHTDNTRGLLHKTRWLVENQLDYAVGVRSKFFPPSARVFAELRKKNNVDLSIEKLVTLNRTLCDIEVKMNSCSIPEKVLLSSYLI